MSTSLDMWAQDLVKHLDEHMDTEREALRAYRDMAEKATDERVVLLVRQILDDEIRHHQQFADLRDALLVEIRGGRRADGNRTRNHRALLDQTDALIALEKSDIRELRRLAREFRKVEDTKWRSLLVEAMELDTRKHIKLLEGVRDLLRESTG